MADDAKVMTGSADEPIQDFSRCHAGILSHLEELGKLPALIEPAAQARRIAEETLKFFEEAVLEHHADEERELFPAVLRSAQRGTETERVREITRRLTEEHRRVEAAFRSIEPELERVARGRDAELDAAAVQNLVALYSEHALYEEQEFLPLSQEILSRNSNHMAALGLSLHLRHAKPSIRGYI